MANVMIQDNESMLAIATYTSWWLRDLCSLASLSMACRALHAMIDHVVWPACYYVYRVDFIASGTTRKFRSKIFEHYRDRLPSSGRMVPAHPDAEECRVFKLLLLLRRGSASSSGVTPRRTRYLRELGTLRRRELRAS